MPRGTFGCHNWNGVCYWHPGNEARNTVKHPTSSHMCPFPKNRMAYHVSSAEVEKHYLVKVKTHWLSDIKKSPFVI